MWHRSWLSSAVLLIVCAYSVHSQSDYNIIYVNSQSGNDSKQCLISNSTSSPCATLHYAVARLTNLTQVVLCGGTHYIGNTISVTGLHNISITGDDSVWDLTIVSCLNGSDAGLKFVDVSDLHLFKLAFTNCGSLLESTTRREDFMAMALFRTAVYILNSTNILIESTIFKNNRGIGLALFDVNGHVSVLNSSFVGNCVPEEETPIYNGGGGLYFEHTYCSPGRLSCNYQDNPYITNLTLNISNCNFIDNHATSLPGRSSTLIHQEKTRSRRLGHGAGISLSLKGLSYMNSITVSNCIFESNSGRYGGAVNINFQDYVRENWMIFQSCQFLNNVAKDGGGGMFVGIFFYEVDTVLGNEIHLEDTVFIGNTGTYGGGTHFAISQMMNSNSFQNSLSFTDCEWHGNSAEMGGALLLVPEAWNTLADGYLPVPVFMRCLFKNNSISGTDGSSSVPATEGVVFSSAITMNFTVSVDFEENFGTAVSVTGATINILNGTKAIFRDNFGTRGGALVLLDFSSLRLFPGSKVGFINNTATEFGGAIYVSFHNDLDFYFSRSCFIRYSDVRVPTRDWNTSIIFYYNYAGQSHPSPSPDQDHIHSIIFNPQHEELPHDEFEGTRGHSIYAVSVLPCIRASDTTGNFTPTDAHAFPDRIFNFYEYCRDKLCGVGTSPARLQVRGLDSDGVLRMAPGEMKRLFLEAEDELNHTIYPVITAYGSPSTLVHVDNASFYVTDDRVQINGAINTSFELILRANSPKQVSITVEAELTDCPPGLVYESKCSNVDLAHCPPSLLHKSKCVCSATTEHQRFEGITTCSVDEFRGLLNIGYWAGCYGENGTLLTAECPLGYCLFGDSVSPKPFYVLPRTCDELDTYLCGSQSRTGVLCGKCMANHSVFFHSLRHNCHVCENKYLGFFLYILSELLPVTLVFLCIISFNIQLTSGAWNSVILFAQIIDLFQVNSLELFKLPPVIFELTSIYQFIFGWFSFDFFKFEDYLSFCIWDGARVIDVLAFKYVTTVFTVFLLLFLILCLRSPCWDRYQNTWKQCQTVTGSLKRHQGWIIHGVSAFLVLSYAHCAKVSFQILSYAQLYGTDHKPVKKVVFLSGDMEFFGLSHLPYAIPALLILILATLPPIILILYPTGVQLMNACIGDQNLEKLQQLCGEDGSRCRRNISLSRFKPLIDSFQGCYRDNCRHFAGLLFLYRFLMALSFALSTNAVTLYISLEILVVVMLAFHSWAQPYRHQFYNLLDTFIYSTLAIVNALSLFNYYWVNYSSNNTSLTVSLVFQLILIFLPIIYFVVMCFLFNLTGCSGRARHCLRKVNNFVPLFEVTVEELELSEEIVVQSSNGTINSTLTRIPFNEQHLPYRLFEEPESSQTLLANNLG